MSISEHHEQEILLPRGEGSKLDKIEWRPWPRHRRYLVGSDGSIVGPSGRALKPSGRGRKGLKYPVIRVVNPGVHWKDAGYDKQWLVSVIVCETFYGPRPEGKQAAHEDGNTWNNCVANLSWKTRLENAADKQRHGTEARGEKHGRARLTEEKVRDIRKRAAQGATNSELSIEYGVHRSHISNVVCRKTWGHVQ